MAQSSNQSSINYVKQTVRGTIPNNPQFTRLDTTSGRLNKTVGYVKSETIRTDGQSTRNIRDNVKFESEFSFEITRDVINLLASALRMNGANPSLTDVTASTISIDSTSKEIRDSGNGLAAFTANSFVFVSGTTNNDGAYYVTTAEAGRLVLDVADGVLNDMGAGSNVTVRQRVHRSGNTANYIALQEREDDESATANDTSYITQRDGIINTMNITIPSSGPITCTIGVVTATQLDGSDAITGQTDATYVERQPLSNLDMTWFPDQQIIPANDYRFTDATIEINSNSEATPAAGIEGAITNSINTITVSGSLNSIGFSNNPRVEKRKQEDGTVFGMSYLLEFENDEKMVITTSRMRYTEGSRERTSDAVAKFSGTYDAETGTSGATIQIDTNY